jgi:hypothetical protein
VGLLEASSILTLDVFVLLLARVGVVAATTTASAAACGASTAGVGALSTPVLLAFLAQLLDF